MHDSSVMQLSSEKKKFLYKDTQTLFFRPRQKQVFTILIFLSMCFLSLLRDLVKVVTYFWLLRTH